MSNLSGDREILEIPAAKKRKLQSSSSAEKEVQNGDNATGKWCGDKAR
jgi:hypothetical protein